MATSLSAATGNVDPNRSNSAFGKVLADSFAGLSLTLQAEFERAVEASRRQTSETLNQTVRRLRNARGETGWSAALADAAMAHAARVAVFTFEGGMVRVAAVRGVEAAGPFVASPLRLASAFAAAVETGEPVVALRSASEMPAPFAAMTGATGQGRFHLFPIHARGRAAAALYADGEKSEVDAANLELIAGIAGPILDANSAGAARPPSWDELSFEEKSVHLRAQRIARVRVAEIRLGHHAAVRQGRAEGDLYRFLQNPIDTCREEFRREFIKERPSMPDYFHLELLRTLANDDEELLGPDYPGPLV